jgi:hypothetical protein
MPYITDPYKDIEVLNRALRRIGELENKTTKIQNNVTSVTGTLLKRSVVSIQVAKFNFQGQAQGLVPLGKTFTLLQMQAPAACRTRLYATTASRAADLTRNTTSLTATTVPEGLIFDLNLPTSFTFPRTWVCTSAPTGADVQPFGVTGNIPYTVNTYGPLHITAPATSGTNAGVNPLAGIGNPKVIRAQFASFAGIWATVPYDITVWFTNAASSGDYGTDIGAGIVLPFYDGTALVYNVHTATTAVQGVYGAYTDWLEVPTGAVDWNWQIVTSPHNFTNANFQYANSFYYDPITLSFTVLTEEN